MKKPIPTPANLSRQSDILPAVVINGLSNIPFLRLPSDKPYPHWDQLRHLPVPPELTHEQWWQWLKFQRRLNYHKIPLQDTAGNPFVVALNEALLRQVHALDMALGRGDGTQPKNTSLRASKIFDANLLAEEAIFSSQLEGASTTRQVAYEMLSSHRAPRDRSERMILNNYRTMQRVSKIKDEPLSLDLVFELQRITTDRTLEESDAAGRFRHSHEDIVVQDYEGEIYHVPPPAPQLPARMAALCRFANGETPDYFLHPIFRAIILHFWLAYDHPFVDGNGRTARALFYWGMLHHGYWLCEYLSISRIIKRARRKYERAFLYTESDENDLTYFVLYHLQALAQETQEVSEYVKEKMAQQSNLEKALPELITFHHRQRALLGHALHHPEANYSIDVHKMNHDVVYDTARTDLLDLAERGLLEKRKIRRTFYFTPVADLEKKLRQQK